MVATTETQLVTVKIDDRDITVPAGTYILQAAEAAGIEVPNLCLQPLLRPWGSCRLCTVEIVGPRGGLIESCATPVRDGMEVLTHSQRVVEARQFILQMYLIDHALDCPTCDKSGECYLQDNTYLHNVENNPYRRPKLAQPYVHHSDYIDYKWDRCIICARCTRVCDEMTGVTAIEISNRALEAEITPAYGIDLSETTCTNCGMCIAVCPVGALTDRHFGHHPWEMDSVETVCGMCDVGCTINAEYTRGIVRRATHLWSRGVNLGYTCELGRWGHEHVQDPTRIWNAQVRHDDRLVDVDLDTALEAAAEGLRPHQGPSFAALASPDNTNEDNYLLQQFTRGVMGSNSIDRLMPAHHAGVDDAMLESFGLIANPAGMQEMMSDANVVLYVGPDAGKVAPIASYWLYWAHRYREATMIVVSPDHFPLADRSDHWLNAKPGTEADVIKALAKIAADNGLLPAAADTSWFAGCDVAGVCEQSGLDLDALTECAILFATGGLGKQEGTAEYPAGTIWYALGDQDRDGARSLALAAHNLAISLDTIGKPGGGVLALRNYANMQGSIDVGCHPGLLPGGAAVGDSGAGATLAETWSTRWAANLPSQNGFVRVNALPDAPGIGVDGLPDAIRSGQIKAMYIAAQSHHRGADKDQFFSASRDGYFKDGDSHIWRPRYDADLVEALKELEFLVVEDCFESELTEIADVVLPTAMYLEKDGTLTNLDRTVQRLRYVVAPPGDSRSSRRHVAAVAASLGYDVDVSNPSAILDEIAAFVPGYRAISFPRLERGGIQWPAGGFGSVNTVRLTPGRELDAKRVSVVAD